MDQLKHAVVREDLVALKESATRCTKEQLNEALRWSTDSWILNELFKAGADDYMFVIRRLIDEGRQDSVWNYFLFDTHDDVTSNLNPHQVLVWLEGHPLAREEYIEDRYRGEVFMLVQNDMLDELREYLPVPAIGQPQIYQNVVRAAFREAIVHSSDPRVLEYFLTLMDPDMEWFDNLSENDAAFLVAPVVFNYAQQRGINLTETDLVDNLILAHRQDVFALFYQKFEANLTMDETGRMLNQAFETTNHRILSLLLTKRIDVGWLIRAVTHTFDAEYERYHKRVVSELMEETHASDLVYEVFHGLKSIFFRELIKFTVNRPLHQVEQLMAIFKQWARVIEARNPEDLNRWYFNIYELTNEEKERLYEEALDARRVDSVIYWIKQGGYIEDVDHPFTHYIKDLNDQMDIVQALPITIRETILDDHPLLRDYIERHQAARLRAYGALPSDLKRYLEAFM